MAVGDVRPGIAMRECRGCGHVVFPPRQLCPSCGAWDWTPRVVEGGVVEAVTQRGENELAAVRTDAGPTVTAVAPEHRLEIGARVRLESRRAGSSVQVRALRLEGVDT